MKYHIFPILMMLAFLASCTNKNDQSPANQAQEQSSTSFSIDRSVVSEEGIRWGKASLQLFASIIKANGVLKVSPQSEASVASPIGANIKRILVVEGQRVRKGQPLALMSHPDLLDLQGRYLAASSKMAYVKQEYQRQKKLYASKVGSGKDFQQISSEYRQLEGELRVTGHQLALLGISLNAVKAGRTVSAITIKSPIAGTVETIQALVGQYADPQSSLFTIVNSDHVYADVMVYENDFSKVEEGCVAQLTSKSWSGKLDGKVKSVGNLFDGSNRAVHTRIAIPSGRGRLVPGSYVTALIHSGSARRWAVPDDALASDADRYYVFIVKEKGNRLTFIPREVHIGQRDHGFTEIRSGLSSSETLALTGAYMLMSEWKKADAEQ